MREVRPYVCEVVADTDTPVSVFLKLRPAGARFLLESVEHPGALGRYSFILVGGPRSFRILEEHLVHEDEGRTEVVALGGREPLALLRERMAREPRLRGATLPPLAGGAVGFLSYDYARFLERIPSRLPDPLGLPVGHFVLVRDLVVFDHVRRTAAVVSCDPARGRARVADLLRRLRAPVPVPEPAAAPRRRSAAALRFESSRRAFEAAVRRAQQYIRAGDIFQVVLSHRASVPCEADPFSVYRALRILNPSPYLFFLDYGEYQLVGSSPEMHVRLQNGTAEIRPIAGTRPRGATDAQDRRREQELLSDEKERAEHLMLVDLARNDLGRVCVPGSVETDGLFSVERYSHVMHMVSHVRGRLAAGQDAYALLAATFPAGTVTGAPKVRAMQIIEELESVRRGPYAGTVGYFSLTGDMDMCIAIRTILFHQGIAYLQAGAGIVYDSRPASEWQEALQKIAALRRALEAASRGAPDSPPGR